MKRIIQIIVLASLISLKSFSQKKLIFKNGDTISFNKLKDSKKYYAYINKAGMGTRVKKTDITGVIHSELAKDRFEYNNRGMTPFVVEKMYSLTASQLYLKTIDWIKDTYKNPEEVIKAKFKNKKVRFSGSKIRGLRIQGILFGIGYTDIRYSIEVSFKDNKFKIQPIRLENYTPYYSQYTFSGWSDISLKDGQPYHNKNGILKSIYKYYPKDISDLFNSLRNDLKIYLLKELNVIEDKSEDW